MPSTTDMDEHYGVTVRPAERMGSTWIAHGDLFRRDTQADIGAVARGEGSSAVRAENAALVAARALRPDKALVDWQGR